ncbi:MAG: glutamate synthase subunit beta [Erysipelotrichaceae bacterium]|nr:glutamate synthase subunit beta [Erysipelotrichaceae bacterium]
MGKTTGFMDYQRHDNPERLIEERIQDYKEFHTSLNQKVRVEQAARCMNCGVPFCQSSISLKGRVVGCPLHNLIPETNDEIYHGHIAHALSRLLKTNNFPEFTSRVCPALCEKACLEGLYDVPVTIHDNENYIIEMSYALGYMKARPPMSRSGKKVAVIGSGPSGLTVADDLNRRGHEVTIYERDDAPGGLLMYGIPNMKLDKGIIDRRITLMKEEGIRFALNADVGKDVSFQELKAQYDAIVLCVGAKQPRNIHNISMTLNGVMFAVDYLTAQTKALLNDTVNDMAKDKHVVIVGGGDTGNDCVATAIRQKCSSVTQLEMMNEPPLTRQAANPWPEWPDVKKTDYGQKEAITLFGDDPRIYNTTVKEVVEHNGTIESIVTVKVEMIDGQMHMIEGTEMTLPCDLLLIAAGFTGVEPYVTEAFALPLSGRSTIETSDYYVSEGLFACGDGRRGQSLVVWAIHEGKECAKAVDRYLMGYTTIK